MRVYKTYEDQDNIDFEAKYGDEDHCTYSFWIRKNHSPQMWEHDFAGEPTDNFLFDLDEFISLLTDIREEVKKIWPDYNGG